MKFRITKSRMAWLPVFLFCLDLHTPKQTTLVSLPFHFISFPHPHPLYSPLHAPFPSVTFQASLPPPPSLPPCVIEGSPPPPSPALNSPQTQIQCPLRSPHPARLPPLPTLPFSLNS